MIVVRNADWLDLDKGFWQAQQKDMLASIKKLRKQGRTTEAKCIERRLGMIAEQLDGIQ